MKKLEDLGTQAGADPITHPTPVETVHALGERRRRSRRVRSWFVGSSLAIGVGVVAVLAAPDSGGPGQTVSGPPTESPEATSETLPRPEGSDEPGDFDLRALIDALEAAGAGSVVESTPSVSGERPFDLFSGDERLVCVDEEPLIIFEYESEATRDSDSSLITPDGGMNGSGVNVTGAWNGDPRFFVRGRLIVLQLTPNGASLPVLSSILGESLTPEAVGRGPGPAKCGSS